METIAYQTAEQAYREIIRTAQMNPRNAGIVSFWQRELTRFRNGKPDESDRALPMEGRHRLI